MSNGQSWTAKLPEAASERLTGRQIAKLKSTLAQTKKDLAAAEARAERLAKRLERVGWCLRMTLDALKDQNAKGRMWRVECDDGETAYVAANSYEEAVREAVERGFKPVDGA